MADDVPTSPPHAADVQAADKRAELRRAALEYHQYPSPGKISIAPTTQLINQHDLALA
jgi:malate dehydrogenase (oxaloacetate-decarboxylating)(NADP+)